MLDLALENGDLPGCVLGILKADNRERDERTKWEFYLHKVEGKTYDEFLHAVAVPTSEPRQTDEEAAETIRQSFGILEGFVPPTTEEVR